MGTYTSLRITGVKLDHVDLPSPGGQNYDVPLHLSRSAEPNESAAMKRRWKEITKGHPSPGSELDLDVDGDILWVRRTTIEDVTGQFRSALVQVIGAANSSSLGARAAAEATKEQLQKHRAHVAEVASPVLWD